MVQKSPWKSASISSLENRNLILVLSPLSLAENKLDYFPGNQISQCEPSRKPEMLITQTPCLCLYPVCVVCFRPALCELWATRFPSWESEMLCFSPGNVMESEPTVIWLTPTENSTSSKTGGSFDSQRERRCKCLLLIWAGPFCILAEDLGNTLRLFGLETHPPLSVPVQDPPPPRPPPPPGVLLASYLTVGSLLGLCLLSLLSPAPPHSTTNISYLQNYWSPHSTRPPNAHHCRVQADWVTTYRGCHIERVLWKASWRLCAWSDECLLRGAQRRG